MVLFAFFPGKWSGDCSAAGVLTAKDAVKLSYCSPTLTTQLERIVWDAPEELDWRK